MLQMLKKLEEAFGDGRLLFFWNKNCNLFDNISRFEIKKHRSRLRDILSNIDQHIENGPLVISRYVCKKIWLWLLS